MMVDTSFPPNKQSLFGKKEPLPEFKTWEEYKWISPKLFYQGTPYTLTISVTPMRVSAGSDLISPILAPLAAISLKPSRISALILPEATNDIFVSVMLFANGELQGVKIDTFFPHNPTAKKFAFLYSDARELWPMIIEKAYAKILGSYQALYSLAKEDCINDIFDMLTGFPSFVLKHKDKGKDFIWKQLTKAQEKKFPVVGLSTGPINAQVVVVDLFEKEEGPSLNKYVTIYVWNSELIDKIASLVPNRENGELTHSYNIPFNDYVTIFQETIINRYRDDYFASKTIKINSADRTDNPSLILTSSTPRDVAANALIEAQGVYLIEIEATKNFGAYVSINYAQKQVRPKFGVLVGFKTEDAEDIEYRDSSPFRVQSSASFEIVSHKKGFYYCIIELEKEKFVEAGLLFIVRGNSKTMNIKQVTEKGKLKDILMGMIKGYALAKGVRTDIVKDIYEYNFMNCLNIWLGKYLVNNTTDSTLISTFNLQKGSASFVAPYRGEKAVVRVNPKATEFFFVYWKKSEEMPVISYKNHVQKSKDKILKEINDDSLHPSFKQELAPGIQFLSYKHDCGILFAVINRTKHLLYKGVHRFTFKNLTLEEEGCGTNVIKTVVTPESVAYKWAYTVDIFQKPDFQVEHENVLETYSRESSTLINEIIKTGTMTKIGKSGAIWTKMIEDHWCMYIKNLSKKDMRITIEVKKSINLKCSEGEKWEVLIKSGDGYVKRVQAKNLFNVSNCSWSAKCNLE